MHVAEFLRAIWAGLGGAEDALAGVAFEGEGSLPSAYAVSDLAAAAVGAAALAVAAAMGRRNPSRKLRSMSAACQVRP